MSLFPWAKASLLLIPSSSLQQHFLCLENDRPHAIFLHLLQHHCSFFVKNKVTSLLFYRIPNAQLRFRCHFLGFLSWLALIQSPLSVFFSLSSVSSLQLLQDCNHVLCWWISRKVRWRWLFSGNGWWRLQWAKRQNERRYIRW